MRGRPCGNKKIQGRKRFIITDVLGLLLALSITEANIGERAGALVVLSKLGNRFSRLKTILADQGFDGVEFITNVKTQFSLTMEVVCQVLGVKEFTVLPKPHRRTGWILLSGLLRGRPCGWFSFHRRLSKDYEVKLTHSEAFIYWTMIRIMSRKIRETKT